MNNVDQKDLLYHMSKGNHTTPADARIEGLKSAFGAKAALFKQVMDVGSSKKHSDVYSSDSDSDSDDMSEDDGFLELTDDEQEVQVQHHTILQAVCSQKLHIVKRADAFDSNSPRVEGCMIRSPISQSVFAKAIKFVEAKLATQKAKSEESIEQQMDNLQLKKPLKTGKPAHSVKSKSSHAAMQETQHETSKMPSLPVSNKLQIL